MTSEDRHPVARRDSALPPSSPVPTLRIRAADFGDIPVAAAFLTQVCLASPHQRLVGSGTVTAIPTTAQMSEVLINALSCGSVDLAVDGEQAIAVACWLHHPPRRHINASRRPLPVSAVNDLLGRHALLDIACNLPDSTAHHHLVYLGVRPGYGARAIADLLLHHHRVTADRNSTITFVAEVHSAMDRDWLRRRGFRSYGISLGEPEDPQSFAMACPSGPPIDIRTRPAEEAP
jgi:hypothetical protein